MKMKLTKKRMTVTAVLAVGCFAALYSGYGTTVPEIVTARLPADCAIRIAVVSDLHSEPSERRQDGLLALLRKGRPDLIALVGDIVDDRRKFADGEAFLKDVTHIAPCYYVTGNHEVWSKRLPEIHAMMERNGITVVEGRAIPFAADGGEILIAGLSDPARQDAQEWRMQAQASLSALAKDERYRVLLSHRPERDGVYGELPVDLILSGHAHGGQVRIPGLVNGLYAPNQGVLPRRTGGMYRDLANGATHLVSRGTSHYWFLPRVLNAPEVLMIDLRGTNL